MSKTLKEKEEAFYKRVGEFEKNQDVVKQTLISIGEFKKMHDNGSSMDDS